MRQAVNNLQSTYSGFGIVTPANVYKVCDQPHPVAVQSIIKSCIDCKIEDALSLLEDLWSKGYSAVDIITTLFKVTKSMEMPEFLRLEYIKVFFSNFRRLECAISDCWKAARPFCKLAH